MVPAPCVQSEQPRIRTNRFFIAVSFATWRFTMFTATENWVNHDAEEWNEVAMAPAVVHPDGDLQFVVRPYLQMVTQNSITVMWETNHTGHWTRAL